MSESADFYMSWLGCDLFGTTSSTQVQAAEPIVVFNPTDLSGLFHLDGCNNNLANYI